MLDLILTILFFIAIFGGTGFTIYKWTMIKSNSKSPNIAVKDPNKFGCH